MTKTGFENKFIFVAAIGFVAGLIGGLSSGWPALNNLSSQEVLPNLERISQSTVTVHTRFPLDKNQVSERIGVGIIIKKDGLIVTNAHLVAGGKNILVKATSNRESPAKIVKIDKQNDLAVIRAENLNLEPPTFNTYIKLGEKVYALGKPFLTTDNFTLTTGIISSFPINLPKGSPKLLQTDAVINPGNSGGPLINQNGEVIAVTTAYLSTGDNVAGIGFAIPIDMVLKFAESSL